MKATLNQIVTAVRSGSLARLASDTGLPVKTSFRLAKLVRLISAEYEMYEQARLKLVDKYARHDADGKTIFREVTHPDGIIERVADFPDAEAYQAFQADGRELLDAEVEIAGEPFTLDDLSPRKLTAGDFLSANDLIALDWLIIEKAAEAAVAPV